MSNELIKTENINDLKPFLLSLLKEGKTEEMVDLVIEIIQTSAFRRNSALHSGMKILR